MIRHIAGLRISSPLESRRLDMLFCGHLSRIRAHPIYLTIQIVCVQLLYTLFRYIINTYIMHKCTLNIVYNNTFTALFRQRNVRELTANSGAV